MPHVNLDELVPEPDDTDPPGFRALMARVGGDLGAKETGASLYVIPPGEGGSPYHYEYSEEEWLLVLSGRPTVRTPEGSTVHAPMDLVFFPTGPTGAHQVRNDTDEEVRVLMWSTVHRLAASAYPDSGKVALHTGLEGEDVMVRRTSNVDYWDGESAPEGGRP